MSVAEPFRVVLADPPWQYSAWSGDMGMRTAESFYATMSVDSIERLWQSSRARLIPDGEPLPDLSAYRVADDAALFLWATAPALPEAFRVMKAWGFDYKTIAFAWVKTTKDGGYAVGLGHYTRANVELVLLGTRGRPERLSKSVRQIVAEPRQEHSRKPDTVYGRIEALFRGPYLELFARRPWPGWTAWGLEAPAE